MHRIWPLCLLWVCICITDIANEPLRRSIDTPATGQWYSFSWYRRPGSDVNDPVSRGKSAAALAAYQEAVSLATFAYRSLDRNDPFFLRYFEAADFRLVRDVYKAIAGAIDGNDGHGSPDVQKLLVFEGSSQFSPGVCQKNIIYACINQNWVYPEIQIRGLPTDAAAISTCSTFYDMPLLVQRKCSDIYGDNDNLLMNSRGAMMLHELIHWRTLTEKAQDFYSIIRRQLNLDHIIDYKLPADSPFAGPPQGIGPLWAHELVAHQNGDAVANADNYRWYVLSKYWQLTCPEKNGGQGWGIAVDQLRPGPGTGDCPDAYDAPTSDSDPNSNMDPN